MKHETEFSIRTFHTDAFGHVNNSRYLEILEEARWRFAEAIGLIELLTHRELGFIIIEMRLRFRRPIREGERVRIQTRLVTLGSASGEVQQTVHRSGESATAVRGLFHFILIERNTGKSVAIDGAIRDLLLDVLVAD